LVAGAAVGSCFCGYGQTAEQNLDRIHKVLVAHEDEMGFLVDSSGKVATALGQMWPAVGDLIADQRQQHPTISAVALDRLVCLAMAEPSPKYAIQETAEEQCEPASSGNLRVAQMGEHLLLVSPSVGGVGNILLLREDAGKSTVVWSIANAGSQRLDPDGLVGAWGAASDCREKTADKDWVRCGPLYADVGKLPSDDKGGVRFYVDGAYTQAAGGTIGKQTSIWRWDGERAELLWIGSYEFMIDQAMGTSFDEDKGVLVIGQKGDFRTMFDCGECIERSMERRVLVTKTGVEDLGVRSLAPEMDVLDGFLWRLASAQAARLLRSQVVEATRESRKIDKTFYSVGMVSAVTRVTKSGADLCVDSDDLGTLRVQMRRTADGGYFIAHVAQPKDAECPRGAFDAPGVETDGH
jgi:hypothetical protein